MSAAFCNVSGTGRCEAAGVEERKVNIELENRKVRKLKGTELDWRSGERRAEVFPESLNVLDQRQTCCPFLGKAAERLDFCFLMNKTLLASPVYLRDSLKRAQNAPTKRIIERGCLWRWIMCLMLVLAVTQVRALQNANISSWSSQPPPPHQTFIHIWALGWCARLYDISVIKTFFHVQFKEQTLQQIHCFFLMKFLF